MLQEMTQLHIDQEDGKLKVIREILVISKMAWFTLIVT